MKNKQIALSLAAAIILGFTSIVGASGPLPIVAPDDAMQANTVAATGKTKPSTLSTSARPTMVEGEILVTFKSTLSTSNVDGMVNGMGVVTAKKVGKKNVRLVKFSGNMSVQQAVNSFAADSNIVAAQPNYLYYPSAVPNDTSYGQVWAHKNTGQTITSGSYTTNNPGSAGNDMDTELAWDEITDCSAIVVAVIDTGINYTHQDLASNMWTGNTNGGWDFIDNDNDPMPVDGQIHGTHVAGTIGARGNNGVGVAGVCWQVQIMALRVLGSAGGTTASTIQAIEYAADNGADVINMSLGGEGGFDPLFSEAITYAQARDVLVVVAAGNAANDNDTGNATWPCNFTQDNLVCVAALDQAYTLASFSNTGTTSVDVGAPGTNILSTWPGSVFTDNVSSGWQADYSGWGFSSACARITGSPGALYNPFQNSSSNWCDTPGITYPNNADATAYKNFNLGGLLGAELSTLAIIDTEPTYDSIRVYARAAGGNPNTTIPLFKFSGSTGIDDTVGQIAVSLENCLTATCTVGARLTSDFSNIGKGIAIFNMEIQKVETNSSVYKSINGTSMASPNVAGIAALVRAYNPGYGYLDTVNAILGSGEDTASLVGTTTTGKAVNAMGALSFINVPTGVSATSP